MRKYAGKKLAALAAAALMTLALPVSALAYNSVSPNTDHNKTEKTDGNQKTDRTSPDTGEAPIMLGLAAAALVSAAGIVVCLKKTAR